ncbi:unnamed protein product, partial [Ectocarpus sp. 13 AM-2016]
EWHVWVGKRRCRAFGADPRHRGRQGDQTSAASNGDFSSARNVCSGTAIWRRCGSGRSRSSTVRATASSWVFSRFLYPSSVVVGLEHSRSIGPFARMGRCCLRLQV